MIPTLLMAIALTGGVFETMPPPEVEAKVGRANILITPGTGGHTHFPDEPIVVLGRRPLRFLMVSSDGHVNGTYLWQGESWSTAVPVEQVLTPGDGPDNGYAGIGALIQDHGRSLAYYHAEDHRDMGHIDVNNVDGFYATVCMAILNRDGRVEKLGPVLTADDPKHTVASGGWTSQGVGEPHVLRNHTGQYLLCYYTRWTEHPRPSTYLCLARASIKHGGRPGTWDKYYQGEFREPGLGGHETPLLSGFQSQVVFVPAWKRYLMTFGMGIAKGCPRVSTSPPARTAYTGTVRSSWCMGARSPGRTRRSSCIPHCSSNGPARTPCKESSCTVSAPVGGRSHTIWPVVP